MSEGNKYDTGKPAMELVPSYPMEQLGLVLLHGKAKYAANNWRKGINVSRNLGAALRHIFAALRREDLDSDSGLPHLAHALCDLMFALETLHSLPEFDDRYQDQRLRPSPSIEEMEREMDRLLRPVSHNAVFEYRGSGG